MSQEVTFFIIVCITAFVGFFSQEIRGIIKRIFEVKGAKLCIPLLAASWFFYDCKDLVLWFLYYWHYCLNQVLYLIMLVLPKVSHGYVSLPLILVLILVTLIPVRILDWIQGKKSHKDFAYPYLMSTILLIVSAFLLL